jgi:hypothetical protein
MILDRKIQKISDVGFLRKKIEKDLEIRELQNLMAKVIIEAIIEKFNGKQITKRIETYVKTLPILAGCVVYYSVEHSCFLRIWGNEISYDNSLTIYLGSNVINSADLKDRNGRHLDDGKRISKIKERLKSLPVVVNKWNTLIDEVTDFEASLGELRYYIEN